MGELEMVLRFIARFAKAVSHSFAATIHPSFMGGDLRTLWSLLFGSPISLQLPKQICFIWPAKILAYKYQIPTRIDHPFAVKPVCCDDSLHENPISINSVVSTCINPVISYVFTSSYGAFLKWYPEIIIHLNVISHCENHHCWGTPMTSRKPPS